MLTANRQIRELQLATSQPLGAIVSIVANALFSFGLAMFYSWKLTLVIVCTVPVMLIVLGWLGASMQPHVAKHDDNLSAATKFFSNAIRSIETVKCFNGQATELGKYNKQIAKAARWYAKIVDINARQAGFTQFMGSAMFVQAFYYGGVLVDAHQKSTGDVVTTFMAAMSAFSSISGIITQLLVLEKGRAAGATLRAVVAQVETRKLPVSFTQDGARPETCTGHIQLTNVSLFESSHSAF